MRLFDVFSYNDDRLVTESLNVQQLAAKSDAALDDAYHYGRSTPGNTFGWQANLASAAYAKEIIDSGETDINKISDAVHKGWWSVAQKFVDDPDQFSDTEALRAKGKFDKKMADRIAQMVPFNELTKDQQDIDRVVAEALLQAITGGGEQGVAEGNFGPAATAAIQQGKSPSDVAYADTKDINNIAKGLKIQQQVATGDDPTLTNAGNAARRAGNTTVEDVAEGTGQVEAYGYRYNNRDQRVVWRKNFPSSEAAYAWADKNNATVIGVRAAEKAVDEAFRLGNKRLGTKRDRFKSIHKPSLVETEPTHRIGVTVTDPNHPMVSKRGETIQKSIRVTHADRDAAINRAIAHYRRKGYKVHDHHYMGTVEPGVAEGILGSDPNRGQKVPGWAKGGIIGKIGRKLDPAWSDIQMTVPQHLLSKQSSVPATNSPATKDMPKVKATSIIPTRAIPKRAGNNSSHSVPKNVVKTIADKQGVAEAFANPGSGSTGTSRGAKRIANTVRKALAKNSETPDQIAARKDFEAQTDARMRQKKKEQGVAETTRMSAAAKLSKAWDQQQAKSAASRKRGQELLNPPKKEEPKRDEKKVDEGIQAGDGFIIECGDSVIETVVLGDYLDGILIEFDHTATFMLIDAGITLTEAEYHGRTVPLGKRMAGDVKKSKVYVKKPNGNVVKVNFGDKNMTIKKHLPKHRKSYRARHHCENPGPKWKANYWSCRAW